MASIREAAAVVAMLIVWGDAFGQTGDSKSPETISVEEYVQKNTLDGTAAKQFVVMRCAALYMFFSKTLGAAGNSKLAEDFGAAALKFGAAAQSLETNKQSTFVEQQIFKMNAIYVERAQNAKARTQLVRRQDHQ